MLYNCIYCDMSWQTSHNWQISHRDTDICTCTKGILTYSLHSHHIHQVCYFVQCAGFLVSVWRSLCFSLMRRTLRCVTQDVLSSPVSIAPAEQRCARKVISTKSLLQLQTPPGGGGEKEFLALRTSLSPWETTFIK